VSLSVYKCVSHSPCLSFSPSVCVCVCLSLSVCITNSQLSEIQSHLFTLGAQLASPNVAPEVEVITSSHVDFLERQIDTMTTTVPELKSFILPGGGKTAALLHMSRTVCRRAERATVYLESLDGEEVDHWVMVYINRLSDFLFMLARLANQLENVEDIPWKPKKN